MIGDTRGKLGMPYRTTKTCVAVLLNLSRLKMSHASERLHFEDIFVLILGSANNRIGLSLPELL